VCGVCICLCAYILVRVYVCVYVCMRAKFVCAHCVRVWMGGNMYGWVGGWVGGWVRALMCVCVGLSTILRTK